MKLLIALATLGIIASPAVAHPHHRRTRATTTTRITQFASRSDALLLTIEGLYLTQASGPIAL